MTNNPNETPLMAAELLPDARERAREIVASATETRYVTPEQYVDVLCRESTLIDRIAAALTTTPAGWQPIETAPKDRRILLWCVHQNAQYAKDPIAEGWEAAVIGEWTTHNGGGWVWHGLAGTHTHWMPLPATPNATTNAATGAQTCVRCSNSLDRYCALCQNSDTCCCCKLASEFPATTTAAEHEHCWHSRIDAASLCCKCEDLPHNEIVNPAATPSISAAIAEVERVANEYAQNAENAARMPARLEFQAKRDAADEIIERLRTLQPSTPSVCEICGCSENEYPEGYRGPCCECACHAGGRIDEARPTPSATPATSAAIEAAKEIVDKLLPVASDRDEARVRAVAAIITKHLAARTGEGK